MSIAKKNKSDLKDYEKFLQSKMKSRKLLKAL